MTGSTTFVAYPLSGADRAKETLKDVLKLLRTLSKSGESLDDGKSAAVFSATYYEGSVKIFVEKKGGPQGWPYEHSLRHAGKLLEHAFIRVVQDAQHMGAAGQPARVASLSVDLPGGSEGKIVFTLVADKPAGLQGGRPDDETEYFV
ncbi:hypothetical protein, conserved [Eimeria praecox]|uniref:Uncharacterized protein n=1 Tax=Eimeria praecox TaxID=51316 RepID=U6H204_9EIME|nr:hypothetical protein, conserved [Eimeria praecox]